MNQNALWGLADLRINLHGAGRATWYYTRQGVKFALLLLLISLILWPVRAASSVLIFPLVTLLGPVTDHRVVFDALFRLILAGLLLAPTGWLACKLMGKFWSYEQLFPADARRYQALAGRRRKLEDERN